MLHLYSSSHPPFLPSFSFFFAFLHPLSYHPSLPCRPFISNRAILSHRRLSHSTQARRFYLRHRNSSFLHIYYLTPAWGRILCILCGRPRTLSLSPSRSDIFLLEKKKKATRERSRLARDPVHARLFCSSARFFFAWI